MPTELFGRRDQVLVHLSIRRKEHGYLNRLFGKPGAIPPQGHPAARAARTLDKIENRSEFSEGGCKIVQCLLGKVLTGIGREQTAVDLVALQAFEDLPCDPVRLHIVGQGGVQPERLGCRAEPEGGRGLSACRRR